MGNATVYTVCLTGATGTIAAVAASTTPVNHRDEAVCFSGLPESVANHAQTRVRSAMANSALRFPRGAIAVDIAPAVFPSGASAEDLAIAIAVMAADDQVRAHRLSGVVLVAELGLDGSLRPVPGVYPALTAARDAGFRGAIVAPQNASEAALVEGMTVAAPADLSSLVAALHGQVALAPIRPGPAVSEPPQPDLADLCRYRGALRALEVAAAGGHHLIMTGPPGAGKTMLAEHLPLLLPPLTDEESREVTALHSLRGRFMSGAAGLIRTAPFEAPHHSMPTQALIGGGRCPGIGSVSLAHRGVLFLDKAAHWRREALSALRGPLDSGEVHVRRADWTVRYPARFLLVLAESPCPCEASRPDQCRCGPGERRRYFDRISRPLRDRIDLRCQVAEPSASAGTDWMERQYARLSPGRVRRAREAAGKRWRVAGEPWRLNSEVPGPALRSARWRLPAAATKTADDQLHAERITVRGYDRILQIAWTLADLHAQAEPTSTDVDAAAELRLGYSTT